jgi:hypothetical protein
MAASALPAQQRGHERRPYALRPHGRARAGLCVERDINFQVELPDRLEIRE